jgi:kynurenine formamidase
MGHNNSTERYEVNTTPHQTYTLSKNHTNKKWQFIIWNGRLPAKEPNRSNTIIAQLHKTGIKEVGMDQCCTTSFDNYFLTTGNYYPMTQHLKTQNVFSVLHVISQILFNSV